MKKPILAFVVLVLALLSCSPTTPETLPTQVPGAIETIIILTADAANAMTQAAMPTATKTPLGTATPTKTPPPPTETPTPTSTFFFSLPTVTNTLPINVPPPGGGGGGGGTTVPTEKQPCALVSQNPKNGAQVKASKKFTVTWNIKNTTNFKWGQNDYDLIFFDGDPIYTAKIYDLPQSVAVGETVALTVTLDAPGKPGYYQTVWRLRGDNLSCYMDITVQVVK